MIVRHFNSIGEAGPAGDDERSLARPLVRADDAIGFSLHQTFQAGGTSTEVDRSSHVEAVLCIEGEGSLEDLTGGEVHPLAPGTIYIVDASDRHRVTALTDLLLVRVLTPPAEGTHQTSGDVESFALRTASPPRN